MSKKEKKKKSDLDMQTTVADMNVEGFSWYDPARKKGKEVPQLTKKEQRALIRGAYKAMLPLLVCMVTVGLFLFLLAMLWLK